MRRPREPGQGSAPLGTTPRCLQLAAVLVGAVAMLQIGFLLGSDRACSSDLAISDKNLPSAAPLQLAAAARQGRRGLAPTLDPAFTGPLPYPNRHFAVFIIYSWNYDMFLLSLRSYMAAGWGRRVVIIDNSPDARIAQDAVVLALVGEVFRTRVQLTFSQCQNLMADLAIERGYEFYFWGHADVALVSTGPSRTFSQDVMACMERAMSLPQFANWGILYFQYDWFSAIQTELVKRVRYDTFITVYRSDCDFYPRVRAAGWQTLDQWEVCTGDNVTVYDLIRLVDIPFHDYHRMVDILEGEKALKENQTAIDRNDWKRKLWDIPERVGWDNWELASQQYFQAKWNTPGCEVEREEPGPDGRNRTVFVQAPWEEFRRNEVKAALLQQAEREEAAAAKQDAAADKEGKSGDTAPAKEGVQPEKDAEAANAQPAKDGSIAGAQTESGGGGSAAEAGQPAGGTGSAEAASKVGAAEAVQGEGEAHSQGPGQGQGSGVEDVSGQGDYDQAAMLQRLQELVRHAGQDTPQA